MVTPVQRLDRFAWWGAAAYLAGIIIAGLAWPHEVAGEFGQETQGSRAWTVVGVVVLSAGAAFALIGIIGWGVKYGREASRTG